MTTHYPARVVASAVAALLVFSGCNRADSNHSTSQSFSTPEAAVTALVDALQTNNRAKLEKLFGEDAKPLVSSGDPVADKAARRTFLERYNAQHQLVAGSADDLVLQVGADEWPLPVPIVRRNGRWSFDGAAGMTEIVSRRIGANELRTIAVLQGFVAAQREYAAVGHDGLPPGIYAQRLRSEPGKQNGLYWESAPGQPQSPIGPFMAGATEEGYSAAPATPYHGYRYRLLFSQSAAARDGQLDYRVGGELKNGFALLAYPNVYGVSGIMTFMVNHDGIVWQRDLGKQTGDLARLIKRFDPDDRWTPIAGETVNLVNNPSPQD